MSLTWGSLHSPPAFAGDARLPDIPCISMVPDLRHPPRTGRSEFLFSLPPQAHDGWFPGGDAGDSRAPPASRRWGSDIPARLVRRDHRRERVKPGGWSPCRGPRCDIPNARPPVQSTKPQVRGGIQGCDQRKYEKSLSRGTITAGRQQTLQVRALEMTRKVMACRSITPGHRRVGNHGSVC